MPSTEEALKRIFAQQLTVQVSDLSADSSPSTIATWDSLRHVELILAIEDAFAVTFDAAEVFALTSLGGIHELLKSKLVRTDTTAR